MPVQAEEGVRQLATIHPRRASDAEAAVGNVTNVVNIPDPPEKHVEQSSLTILLQVILPFLLSGFGTVGAGILFDIVQHWPVFRNVPELFIMVPSLLGLKGNLEMTLASRLSTHANLGHMDTRKECLCMATGNLALVQCQAIVVSSLGAFAAVGMGLIPNGNFDIFHALLVCASALATASTASFILDNIMIGVILVSRRLKINPDNIATPIAASLGDLISLGILSGVSSLLFKAEGGEYPWLVPLLVICWYLLILPVCICIAYRNGNTKAILSTGWTPVIAAMVISSVAGVILNYAVAAYKGIAVYQPVINGIGGNLVAIQASRVSTSLHATTSFGNLPDNMKKISLNPIKVFFSKAGHSRSARILLLLVIPGHVIFIYLISFLQGGHHELTAIFVSTYLTVAFVQVLLLLFVAYVLIHYLWKRSIDPDNSSIPYLTALGDLVGIGLLSAAFYLLYTIGDRDTPVTV